MELHCLGKPTDLGRSGSDNRLFIKQFCGSCGPAAHGAAAADLDGAGEYLGEDFYAAGGVPAVVSELMRQGLIEGGALTANGAPSATMAGTFAIEDEEVSRPMKQAAGFSVLRGNLFESAIMKLSVISEGGVASIVAEQEGGEQVEVGLFGREGMSDLRS